MQAEVAKLLGFAEPFAYVDVEVCGIGKRAGAGWRAGLPQIVAIAVEQEWAAWREKLGKVPTRQIAWPRKVVDTLRVAANASTEFDRRSSGTQSGTRRNRSNIRNPAPLAMALLEREIVK